MNSKLIFLLMFTASLAWGNGTEAEHNLRLARELRSNVGPANVNVIVQFTKAPTARHHQKVVALGGTLHQRLTLINAGSYSIPAAALHTLARDPEVAYISPDRQLFSAGNASPVGVLDYHTDAVNAPVAWSQNLNGLGIGVAVIDSGVADTPDLQSQNVVFSQNFVATSRSARDQFGHGTHVAGLIAGTGKNSTG